MKQTILAIGAHIGDMELTAGGVLATYSLQGHNIITLALTAGERGNPESITVEDYRKQKIVEAKTFAKMLNGKSLVLDYKDGELPYNEEIAFEVCDIIRYEKPTLIITHWKNSMHKDHENAYRIVKDAQFYAGLPSIVRRDKAIWAPVYFAENWEDTTDFNHYILIKISDEGYNLWIEALKHHWFVTNSKDFKYLEYYDALSKVRGLLARGSRAQSFNIEERDKKIIKSVEYQTL